MRVILFDGVCNLCNGYVNWMIDHDKKEQFKFASLQSEYGRQKVAELELQGDYMNTIVYYDNGKGYTHSSAVLRILKQLGGLYSLMSIFLLVPPFMRNFFYNLVARNRYKWFGKRETCRIPTPALKARFLE
ncbi:MAG TPA: DCC1-like thiol-disulfide oxidoreductase family protein [Chitinophagales bacterium]|nr:DCC1-like thiol-disulfide oxidoreductase family protein [Chitinophagales bacterium]